MTGLKWVSVFVSALTLTVDVLANVLVALLTSTSLPVTVDLFAALVAAVFALVAFAAYIGERLNSKLDLVLELLINRFEDLESRVGDRNSGFVEGYLLGQAPQATVVPLTPRIGRRGAGSG
ncbi:MAG TPA: hypothetical protein VJT31_09040 [Rugosimonospora sp.]|nr:hypothetical protein [Rugosimonospora sp.]